MSEPVLQTALEVLQEIADGRKYQHGDLLGVEARAVLGHIAKLRNMVRELEDRPDAQAEQAGRASRLCVTCTKFWDCKSEHLVKGKGCDEWDEWTAIEEG